MVPNALAAPPPEKGPMLVVGHLAGAAYERPSGSKDLIVLDAMVVIDGNVVQQGENPDAADERRTWVGGIEFRCRVSTRTCWYEDWFLLQVPVGSFVYDAVRGEARLVARIGPKKHDVIDHYFAVTDAPPNRFTPIAGWTPDGDEMVVTGGVGVARPATVRGNLFGRTGEGLASIVSGVIHNVYMDSPVGTRLDLSKLLP